MNKDLIEILDADLESDETIVYPKFESFFSRNPVYSSNPHHHGLFDETPEQISHGTAPWDEYGWSRDGWII